MRSVRANGECLNSNSAELSSEFKNHLPDIFPNAEDIDVETNSSEPTRVHATIELDTMLLDDARGLHIFPKEFFDLCRKHRVTPTSVVVETTPTNATEYSVTVQRGEVATDVEKLVKKGVPGDYAFAYLSVFKHGIDPERVAESQDVNVDELVNWVEETLIILDEHRLKQSSRSVISDT